MNIVYLIGNGFDLNLGMKTSYADFYESYLKYPFPTDAEERLISHIAAYKDSNLWSDLEKGFGQYTVHIKNTAELREVYFALNDNLHSYLRGQVIDDKYLNSIYATKLKKDLANPQHYFVDRIKRNILDFMSPNSVLSDTITIISFNYTDTIEKVLDLEKNKLPLELVTKNASGSKRILHSIFHIHGTLDDTELILGVDDPSQIANETFREDPSALSMLMKPQTTINRGDLLDEKCEQAMDNADMFCLFGVSLGETDNKWWNILCNRFSNNNVHIIYYPHSDKEFKYNQDKWDAERKFKEDILEKFVADGYNKTELAKRVHVAINSNMFSYPNSAV